MLLSSAKFESKAEEVMNERLDAQPKHVKLEKKMGGGHGYEKVTLEGPTDGSGGMMLYTSGTTNRPVSRPGL
jgi:malonyl-CoA/methylmalonyl-CoA synthetase